MGVVVIVLVMDIHHVAVTQIVAVIQIVILVATHTRIAVIL